MSGSSKRETYAAIVTQLQSFFKKYDVDIVGKEATICAILKMNFPSFWFVGFYTLKADGATLQIGPYQGDLLACGEIALGKGVCGTAVETRTTQIVDDVTKIDNYIACDDDTKSEIVVPVFRGGALYGVLDLDSDKLAAFDAVDAEELDNICKLFIQ